MLDTYLDELLRWNARINLVAKCSRDEAWSRHIQDSVQIVQCAEPPERWTDLGSGGGLPGMVVAILLRTSTQVTMIEADHRKGAFLRHVARVLDLDVAVISERIERAPTSPGNVVSARALAPLATLLGLAEPHRAPGGILLFPKGVTWRDEVDEALATWRFDVQSIPSRTRDGAAILRIVDPERR
ncbi:16S rRNA (guanine(527)-N(7))-methyltransferase RsmG [Jannaschia sp. W003]|uniref:16S rRNA (guanine(527)-N(7))-methyltransferase RsmG n=1 Tax=Jannaschia sp. W003 TaxID=2867012 RepID=UPI0021A4D7FC|nr:16S rRNA (guanine(527)-N(7))-methyltransferase RsmG [Jannaschia sp. W003]UWQ21992.1 16S rRNA (guanine(527)-N(7))-methyltransferase RsmG [Jannaschia sp. W003]